MNKALFLDRDGIINKEKNYLYRIEDFEFIGETLKLMKEAQKKGYLIIVVSNQAGIAKGKFTEDQFLVLNNWMIEELKNRKIRITESLYCPYHKDAVSAEYRLDSFDRKPNPGMILKALQRFEFVPCLSYMVGDRFSDVLAGYHASVKNLYLLKKEYSYRDYYFKDYPDVIYSEISDISEIKLK